MLLCIATTFHPCLPSHDVRGGQNLSLGYCLTVLLHPLY
nr:MAG TPA: hypothetical protein [Caudoviricetes sp.]